MDGDDLGGLLRLAADGDRLLAGNRVAELATRPSSTMR